MSNSQSAMTTVGAGGGAIRSFLGRQMRKLAGFGILTGTAFGVVSLATWNVADPSFSHATSNPVTNAAGYPGAVFSDLAMQFFGLGALLALVPLVIWGVILATGRTTANTRKRIGAACGGVILACAVLGCIAAPATWPLPAGLGGVAGDAVLKFPAIATGGYPTGWLATLLGIMLSIPAAGLLVYACNFTAISTPGSRQKADDPYEAADDLDDEDEDHESAFMALAGNITHWWLSFRAYMHRRRSNRTIHRDPDFSASESRYDGRLDDVVPAERAEPGFDDYAVEDDPAFDMPDEFQAPARPQAGPQAAVRVAAPAPRPQPGSRISREAQPSLINTGDFEMPSLHLLSEPKNIVRDNSLSSEALEQNARLLEGVLEDFGVRGEIIEVRPGPVVTLYELEPAPGIKSSRVIGLADDIARSMSAIAARVAVVPGRNAIGIELPNQSRETVFLREILASKDFEKTKAKLAFALGKTINGESVIADLAKMPHLLVAGTTGSGKSVAINTMILSLLYRMTPQQCRLIMIDPKMLELSVYDGIPHLLTPVVTDPKKAVVALKWTVREMENRYRAMSKVGVRNIDGFNQRVAEAAKKGKPITRTVQTGFDRETGEAIFETEELSMEPMPFIVVIIDEMADLMMVAGKDIEGAVQRLAQMARAAGIHVVMATQRPSVDVITGTIKANFPTRISFQVTSKIDSRTILGEMGAEQLLGMGDMLYMAGGGRIQRVHGPFVSDDEVEHVVSHLKLQGVPEYLDAITEDDGEDDSGSGGSGGGNFGDSDDPYDQAVAVVLRDGKASTSYIQRRLGIGYNRAASLIERMEEEGVIGPANHAGKREILVPTEEDKF